MKVLVVYELVPESTKVYILDVDVETGNKLQECHNHYINADMEDDLADWLSAFLADKESVEMTDGLAIPIDECRWLIHTGFLL